MGIAQLVYPSDIAKKPEKPDCDCGCHHDKDKEHHHHHHAPWEGAWIVPPPPPGYPPYPYYPIPDPDHDSEEQSKIKSKSIEAQICKLSKKSAAIKAMIDNFENKKKDAIIKIGGVSYNFGPYKITTKDEGSVYEEESEYGERIMELLVAELESIKAQLQELASELDGDE